MKTFKTMLERKEVLKEFDRYVFESIVEKVIVGETDENGDVDPYKLTFVYKTGFKDDLDGERFKIPRKNASSKNKIIGRNSAELSSYASNHVNKSSSYSSDATCGNRLSADKKLNVLTPENSVFTVFTGVNLFYDGGQSDRLWVCFKG